jgi:hypothetical protein
LKDLFEWFAGAIGAPCGEFFGRAGWLNKCRELSLTARTGHKVANDFALFIANLEPRGQVAQSLFESGV